MPTRKLAGKLGRVTVDSTNIGVETFELDINSEKQETTNSESSGWREFVAGISGWSGSFSATYDAGQNPHADPPDINQGNILAASFILEVGATNEANGTYSGNIFVESVKISLDVQGKVKYDVTFTGTGQLTIPTAGNMD